VNVHAWDIYQKVSGQVIVAGMGDILGIKFEAIDFIFKLYEINDIELQRDLFEKIQHIDTIRLKERSKVMASKTPKTSTSKKG
jgi:hypothetical protein